MEKIMWYFQCNIGMNGKKIIRWVRRWFLSPWKWGSFHRKYCPSGLWFGPFGVLAMESNLLWQSLLVLVGVGMELNQWKGSPVVNIGKWQSLLISISHIFPFFSCFSVLEGEQWRECLVLRRFLFEWLFFWGVFFPFVSIHLISWWIDDGFLPWLLSTSLSSESNFNGIAVFFTNLSDGEANEWLFLLAILEISPCMVAS